MSQLIFYLLLDKCYACFQVVKYFAKLPFCFNVKTTTIVYKKIFLYWSTILRQMGHLELEFPTTVKQHFSHATTWPHGKKTKCSLKVSKQILQSFTFSCNCLFWFKGSKAIRLLKINSIISWCPFEFARSSAVLSFPFLMLMSQPFFKRSFAISFLPRAVARWNGVSLLDPWELILAPFWRSN